MTLLRLPDDEDEWINANGVLYFIQADWIGEHDIVSQCGWWRGEVCIVQDENGRFIDWLKAYSLRFGDE